MGDSDPERLRPGESRQALTERAAATFAELAFALQQRGHDPHTVAHFVNRLVFCMFAEDVGLLPNHMFTRMLEQARQRPDKFAEFARDLFRAMASGGRVGFEPVAWFDGGLFDDDHALPLERAEIETALAAAALDWAEIDPSLLGTLFERGLDPAKRAQLGAHYTDRDKIMLIVEPVIVRPWLAEWETAKADITAALKRAAAATSKAARTRQRGRAERLLRDFLVRLRAFTVLDPACGSGNFLYLALHALKDLEHRVQVEAEALGFPRTFPVVGPANVKGIEVNAYAAELARVSVWIGEIQWMRRNGFKGTGEPGSRDPILKPLDTIECRDAILTPEGGEPDWPEADVVIGNPPFLGDRVMRGGLGHEYTERLRRTYRRQLPASADLVCYWFRKTGKLVAAGEITRAGLVATNSIRGGMNRVVLDRIVERSAIFNAWSDEPWTLDGAAVQVSLICFAPKDAGLSAFLNGQPAAHIHADLTTGGVDLTRAARLNGNAGIAFLGVNKNGPFDIPGDLAREWLRFPTNPNGRPNADVLKPRVTGMDLSRRSADNWIIDFGSSMPEADAALYEAPFAYVAEHVRPVRQGNRIEKLREEWWRHWAPAAEHVEGGRHPVSLHRHTDAFQTSDLRVAQCAPVPDHQLILIARDDDTAFGILHSRFHEQWSLRLGTSLGEGPRYTPTTTFETFPFPAGLTPDIPAADYAEDPRATAIAEAAQRLVTLRDHWLNPPEWVEWIDEPVPGYPKRPVPRDDAAAEHLKARTLTNLYNARPQWLADAHAALDAAVAAAYGWPADITDDEALRELLQLNLRDRDM